MGDDIKNFVYLTSIFPKTFFNDLNNNI